MCGSRHLNLKNSLRACTKKACNFSVTGYVMSIKLIERTAAVAEQTKNFLLLYLGSLSFLPARRLSTDHPQPPVSRRVSSSRSR